MGHVLRLSPSGPPLRGDTGSVAEPGTGFQLRLDEAAGSTVMGELTTEFQPITDIGGHPFQVKLSTPAANKRYKFNSHFEVRSLGSDAVVVSVRAMVSYDGGSTRQKLRENIWELPGETNVKPGLDVPMTLGSNLFVPVPGGAPEIAITLEAKRSAVESGGAQIPNGGEGGTIWLSLAELL